MRIRSIKPEFWQDVSVNHDESDKWTHLEPIPKPWTCALYRMYDDSGELLYVGTSVHPNQRFLLHRRKKAWWGTVSWIELWLCKDSEFDPHDHRRGEHSARHYEGLCVMEQGPKYNLTGRG